MPLFTDVTGFSDEKMAENEFLQRKTDDVLAVVVFTRIPSGNGDFTVEYKLRFSSNLRSENSSVNPFADNKHWSTSLMFPVFQKIGPRHPDSRYGGPPGEKVTRIGTNHVF